MKKSLDEQIFELIKDHGNLETNRLPFDKVPISGKVYDEQELLNGIKSVLDGWWTEGKWTNSFEHKIKSYLGINHCSAVNSGSSANLLALKTLTSYKLGEKRIKKGDEIITIAAGFPTTISAIIQSEAVPVFVDVKLGTYNAKVEEVKEALSNKTKAIFLAHSLGNPFELKEIKNIAEENNLWLIEDNCDALGSKYNGKYTGTFGDLATLSFYPAHHVTTAEGGAIITDDPNLLKISQSFRDWGRDCWCSTGEDNSCKRRYDWQLGNLPKGYDHKYTYSEIGYNMKMTDLQASIGVAQMDKLEEFSQKRKDNFKYLLSKMKKFEDYFTLPKATENSEPSWFGFPLTIKDKKIDRTDFLKFMNQNGIATRLLFAGNIIKQPCFVDRDVEYRVVGDLENTNTIMNKTFWLGTYPRLNNNHSDYVESKINQYLKN